MIFPHFISFERGNYFSKSEMYLRGRYSKDINHPLSEKLNLSKCFVIEEIK